MCVVLRRKLAEQLDADDIAAHAVGQLVRQFREVDERIRAIDAKAAEDAAAQDDDDDLDDGEAAGWDDEKI
jgi:hypothetical protein